jgi:UDPglucose--hexose-1-phosphate uridylyltransferase
MPELRKDPIIGRWVIIATERARRPQDFPVEHDEAAGAATCPFCPGAEDKTPRELLAYRAGHTPANTPGWSVRVVPNRYPALMIEGALDKKGVGLYDKMNGIGAHEVIIETPEHDRGLADLSAAELEAVLRAWRERMVDLARDQRFRYLLVFKNHGRAAGATLAHSHSQLIALPVVPRTVKNEIDGARAHYEHRDRCVFCDIVGQELDDGARVVYENDRFLSFCPFAPRFPFECCILPKRHASAYELMDRPDYAGLADALRATLRKLDGALDHPPYNLMLHSAPVGGTDRDLPHFHWHVELIPKLGSVAGFEWGSGFYINPVAPESAAEFLRKVSP